MKIEKAIEILEDKNCIEYRSPDQDYRDALKLGIEAMIFLKSLRDNYKPKGFNLLPGETDE